MCCFAFIKANSNNFIQLKIVLYSIDFWKYLKKIVQGLKQDSRDLQMCIHIQTNLVDILNVKLNT